MNVEENRLKTFENWPSDAAVNPRTIAKAGFFSTKQGAEVECFACHIKISDWYYGDQAMARHRTLSPTCLFVLNPSASGNIPSISPMTAPSCSFLNYRDENVRLASFTNWPAGNIVSPERLSRAGFYYCNDGDNAQCAYCKGVVRAWEPNDDPDIEHKRHFPTCPFVVTVITPRINRCEGPPDSKNTISNINLLERNVHGNLDELGVQTHKGPKRADFGTIEARLRSFTAWPPDLIQTPNLLAQAGFYYEGLGDQVRCFHCDGGLRHWDPHDDPWTEHARWFPTCSFVKLVKGQEFVTACALETNTQSSLENADQKIQTTRRRRKVTERELQEQMVSDAALTALTIGINAERVKRALREKLEQTGRGYSQPDALVEAALNLQLEEDDNFDRESRNRNVLEALIDASSKRGAELPRPDRYLSSSPNTSGDATDVASNDPPKSLSIKTHLQHSISAPNLEKGVSLEEENRILKEARLCKICMDGEVGIVFLPCGHLATCVNCAPNLKDCPVCRSAIKATVRTFLS